MIDERHVIEELSAFLDGEADDAARIDAHLRACPTCMGHFRELKSVAAQVRKLRAPEVRPEFVTRVLARVREEEHDLLAVPWWKWWIAGPRLAFAGGALALLALIAAINFAPGTRGPVSTVQNASLAPGIVPTNDVPAPAINLVGQLANAGVDVADLADDAETPDAEVDVASDTDNVIEEEFLAMLDEGWTSGDDVYDVIDELNQDEQAELQRLLQGEAPNGTAS